MIPKALPVVDPAHCTGCGWCVGVCPPHVLSLQTPDGAPWGRKRSVLHDAAGCTGCALCFVRCPFDAIRMVRTDNSHLSGPLRSAPLAASDTGVHGAMPMAAEQAMPEHPRNGLGPAAGCAPGGGWDGHTQ